MEVDNKVNIFEYHRKFEDNEIGRDDMAVANGVANPEIRIKHIIYTKSYGKQIVNANKQQRWAECLL